MTGKPVSFFAHLIAGGTLPVLWGATSPEGPPVAHLAVTLVRELAEAPPSGFVDPATTLRTREWITEYLRAVPPVPSYDEAVSTGAPYIARAGSRHGPSCAHIQMSALVAFLRSRDAELPDLLQSRLKAGLVALGATNPGHLRGDDGRMRGHLWWRLPVVFWSAEGMVTSAYPVEGPPFTLGVSQLDTGWEDDVSDVRPEEESS